MFKTPNDIEEIIMEMDKDLKELNTKIELLKQMYSKLYLYRMSLLELIKKEK